jgi:hypothetical protein
LLHCPILKTLKLRKAEFDAEKIVYACSPAALQRGICDKMYHARGKSPELKYVVANLKRSRIAAKKQRTTVREERSTELFCMLLFAATAIPFNRPNA